MSRSRTIRASPLSKAPTPTTRSPPVCAASERRAVMPGSGCCRAIGRRQRRRRREGVHGRVGAVGDAHGASAGSPARRGRSACRSKPSLTRTIAGLTLDALRQRWADRAQRRRSRSARAPTPRLPAPAPCSCVRTWCAAVSRPCVPRSVEIACRSASRSVVGLMLVSGSSGLTTKATDRPAGAASTKRSRLSRTAALSPAAVWNSSSRKAKARGAARAAVVSSTLSSGCGLPSTRSSKSAGFKPVERLAAAVGDDRGDANHRAVVRGTRRWSADPDAGGEQSRGADDQRQRAPDTSPCFEREPHGTSLHDGVRGLRAKFPAGSGR